MVKRLVQESVKTNLMVFRVTKTMLLDFLSNVG